MKVIYKNNIAITGYEGYLGSNLSRQMNMIEIGKLNNIPPLKTIVHFASKISNDNISFLNNIQIDLEIFEYCRINKSHLIYTSTNNIYPLIMDCDINTPSVISDYYSASKIFSEQLMQNIYKDVQVTCLRIGDVYGHRQKHGNFMRSIENSIKNKSDLILFGEGSKLRSYIYIKDVVNLIQFLINKNINGIFNVCYKDTWTIFQIINFISKECGLNIINKNADIEKNIRTMIPTPIPEFQYSFNLETGIKDYIKEIKND